MSKIIQFPPIREKLSFDELDDCQQKIGEEVLHAVNSNCYEIPAVSLDSLSEADRHALDTYLGLVSERQRKQIRAITDKAIEFGVAYCACVEKLKTLQD